MALLRRMDTKIDRLGDDSSDVRVRLTSLEAEAGHLRVGLAGVNNRLDRLEGRVERIELGLDLLDHHVS